MTPLVRMPDGNTGLTSTILRGGRSTSPAATHRPRSVGGAETAIHAKDGGDGSSSLRCSCTANTNINAACDQLFSALVKKPGDSYTGDQLNLQNAGSIDATALKLTAGSCLTSNAGGESFHGTGNLCPLLDVYVQEWTDNTYSVASHCWYGGGNATTCAFDDTKTLSTLNGASPFTLTGGLNAGSDRYFTVGVELQNGAGNTVQGRSAAADLTWHIDQ